jgi:hypothetical protein
MFEPAVSLTLRERKNMRFEETFAPACSPGEWDQSIEVSEKHPAGPQPCPPVFGRP